MSKDYDHNSIKVLKKLEPIQKSPGMFIGSTEKATHLFTEAFDNAQDEALSGNATLIAVIINTKTKEYIVMDNGRGIPFKNDTIITVATELFSGGKFEKGIDENYGIACLRGDTKILLLNGKYITIEEMVNNPEKEYWVLTSTTDGIWCSEKAIAPSISGYTNKLIRVYIDNDTHVDCTEDHKFLMQNGTYKEAKDLRPNDSLMPCYIKNNENNHKVLKIEYLNLKEQIPVYDLHTPLNHNFVLSNGIVVHNSGLHGVGIVAITALSDFFEIEVIRDGKHAKVRWEKGDLITPETEIEDFDQSEKPFGTKLHFKPSKKYFGSIDLDIDYIRKRMKLASVHIPKLKLGLIIDDKKEVISCDINEYFKNEILEGEKTKTSPCKDLHIKVDREELFVRWCYAFDGSPTPKHHGSVNILVVDQGTHIDETNRIFRDVLFEIATKKKLNIIRNDCLVGFRALTNILIFKTEFSSQNKERFSKKKQDLLYLYDKLKLQLIKQLNEDEDLLYSILIHFENYRKRLDSTKTILKSGESVTRASSTIGGKLRDCSTHSVDDSELFIVEGESAAGTIIGARNPKIHAVLPLRGKSIPNVAAISDSNQVLKKKSKGRNATKKSSSENKSELVELINACGTGIIPDFNISGIRYGKIIITCDGDADGSHIATIIQTAFLKLMPEIINKGYLYICMMPLYGVRTKTKFIPFYSEEEMLGYKNKNPKEDIIRFKGLGEMNTKQLAVCTLDPKTRRLIQIQSPKDPEKIFKLMTDASLKRKLV